MWNSVSRAFSYGWNVGFSLIRKMSDKVFDAKNIEDDVSFLTYKVSNMSQMTIFIIKKCDKEFKKTSLRLNEMADQIESFEKKLSELTPDQKEHREKEIEHLNLETQTPILFDSLDETSPKSGLKKANKINENVGKTTKSKSPKAATDVRWNHVGSGSSDYRWYNSEKLEKSQSDLSTSKWVSNAESSLKSEFSHKSPTHTFNSSESDLFPSRGGISINPNEPFNSRPHCLFKSSSSSQLPSIRGNYIQSSRQWKYGSNTTTKPISVISMQQSYTPLPPLNYSNPASNGRNACHCGENCGKKNNRTESFLSLTEDAETPEGLSWRRLHMSRAKLKATATTSELLSGFAMVAMVELQINKPTAVPEWLFVLFAVCTTILVSVHIFALMISTYLLPNIDAVSKLHVSSLVTESPHDRMKSFIELAWAFSTILGLFLFLVEIAILCWVKFWDYSFTAAMSATMIIMPVLVLFVAFAMHFYHSLVVIKCKTSVSNMQELENMKRQLDNVSPA